MGAPDVCKTPTPGGPVPIPYPNIAMMNQAKEGTCSKKLLIKNKPTLTIKSEIPMSTGDEAGCAGGGVVSSKMKGPCTFTVGSSLVKVEGNAALYMLVPTKQNGKTANIVGAHIAPSQSDVTTMY